MLDAGASLIQVFTGLVYAGPALPRRILDGLARAG
jgi:dihydroorotate dehydrogenase